MKVSATALDLGLALQPRRLRQILTALMLV